MNQNLAWLMTVAWPLEDAAYGQLSREQRDEWNAFYDRMKTITRGVYTPICQTCWY